MSAAGVPFARHWSGRRALGQTAAINVLVLVLGLATSIITARALGAEGRGAYALAITISALAGIVVGFGLQQATGYFVAQRPEIVGAAIGLSVWLGVGIGTTTAASGIVLVLLLERGAASQPLVFGLASIPLSLVAGNLVGVLQGMRQGRAFNALRVSVPAVFALSLLVAIGVSDGLSASVAVAMQLVAVSVSAVLALALVRPYHADLKLPGRDFVREVLRYGVVVNVGALSYAANRQLSLLVIAAAGSLTDAGLYSVALGYATPVTVVASAIALHTLPDIAAAQGCEVRRLIARRRLQATAASTFPLVLAGVVAAPILVPIAFGTEFVPAVGAAQVLVLAFGLLGVGHVLSEICRGLGRPGLPAASEGIGAVVTVVLLGMIVSQHGALGAAWVIVAAYGLVCVILALGTRRALNCT